MEGEEKEIMWGTKDLFRQFKVLHRADSFFPLKKLVGCSGISVPVCCRSLWLCEGWERNSL